MKITQHILEALESLSANKLRSSLTMLGVIIGVASVISMMAIGTGTQTSITNQINSIGTNLIYISSGGENAKVVKGLTMLDVNALNDPLQAPDVLMAVPVLSAFSTVSVGKQSTDASITASTADYAALRSMTLAEGSFISQENLTGRSAVAVLGSGTAETLFGRTSGIVGLTIRIGSQPFRVIGVLESKGGSSLGSQDNTIIVPLTTAQSRLMRRNNRSSIDQIMVQATSADTVSSASDEISAILRSRHKVAVGLEDFTLTKQEDLLSTAASITGTLTLLLGGIGGISLVVGGIGIMNIMLVSVTERTREIGLRKALGAKRSDILLQFLMESGLLSLFGGLIGVAVAFGVSKLISSIAAASSTNISPVVGWDSVLLATLFSLAVGIFFGIYPANRAARLEPVEALRAE
jgi:putative ABC transport system permease protein